MLKQVHAYIKGDVIGVGFRAWTKIQTKTIKVTGWVRNSFENEHMFGKGGVLRPCFKENKTMLKNTNNGERRSPSFSS